MKRCSAKPYEGSEKYIFVSYCHKDKKHIYPIIERLARDGYRVWYDEGIDPGSEWPEIIAMHLNDCAVCVAFISENSLNSHNCRREISFALLKKKSFISVVIEPVKMSLGMEMQLSANQSIFKYTLQNDEEYYKKMYEAKALSECLGIPNSSIIVSKPSDYGEEAQGMFVSDNSRDSFSDKWFTGSNQPIIKRIELNEESQSNTEESAQIQETAESESFDEKSEEATNTEYEQISETKNLVEDNATEDEPVKEDNSIQEEQTGNMSELESVPDVALESVSESNSEFEPENTPEPESDEELESVPELNTGSEPENTLESEPESEPELKLEDVTEIVKSAWLLRSKTNEKIDLMRDETKLGRSDTKCDYAIIGNSAIGRYHARIVFKEDEFYLIDNTSTNKTFLNGNMLVPEEEYKLAEGDIVRLANEKFIFHKSC